MYKINASERLKVTAAQTAVTTALPLDKAWNKVFLGLQRALAVGKKFEAQEQKVPAGPDTSKFTTNKVGTVSFENQVTIPGGQYGLTRKYPNFLKIGSAIDPKNRAAIRLAFIKELNKMLKTDLAPLGANGASVTTSDGAVIGISVIEGSAWGGIGMWLSQKAKPKE